VKELKKVGKVEKIGKKINEARRKINSLNKKIEEHKNKISDMKKWIYKIDPTKVKWDFEKYKKWLIPHWEKEIRGFSTQINKTKVILKWLWFNW